jgi:hypothetical protein
MGISWHDVTSRRHAEEHVILLGELLESRFPHMRGRSVRVAAACACLAEALAFSPQQRYSLALAARCFDVGMLGVPDDILNRHGTLSPEEKAQVARHVDSGGRLLAKLFPDFPDAVEAVFYHHERADGTGPNRVGVADIPLAAVLMMCDALEAMANDRPHRVRLPKATVARELAAQAGKQFVPSLVRVALMNFEKLYATVAPGGWVSAGGTQRGYAPAESGPSNPASPPTVPSVTTPPVSEEGLRRQKTAPATSTAVAEVLLTRDEAVGRIRAALKEKAPSPVVSRVLAMAANPRTDVTDLTGVVAADPVLSARVLQVANSAGYASGRVVTSLQEAIRHVGCATVRNIAATLGVFELAPTTGGDPFNPVRCWQHSLAVAHLTERFVRGVDESLAGVGYLAGLCHELGALLFHCHFGVEYGRVLEEHARTGTATTELERRMLGVTQNELAAEALAGLGLPSAVVGPIEDLLRTGGAYTRIDKGDPVTRALRLADLYAHGLLLATGPASVVAPLTRSQCAACTGSEAPTPPDSAIFTAEIRAMTVSLARLSAEDELALMTPPLPRHSVKVWVARDPALAELDPLSVALSLLAEAQVSHRLPTAAELPGLGAVVAVLGPGAKANLREEHVASIASSSVLTFLTIGLAEGVARPLPNLTHLRWPVRLQDLDAFLQNATGALRAVAA